MTVYVTTNRFKPETFYYNANTQSFSTALNNTPELIKHGRTALEEIFRKGREYTKAGVVFLNLTRNGCFQQDLFDAVDRTRSARVMQAMDQINQKMGSHTLKYMATREKIIRCLEAEPDAWVVDISAWPSSFCTSYRLLPLFTRSITIMEKCHGF
jgi:hypothetical protein